MPAHIKGGIAVPANTKKPRTRRQWRHHPMHAFTILLLLTVFELIVFPQVLLDDSGKVQTKVAISLGAYVVVEWIYFFIGSVILKKKSLELEGIGFFLTAIGLAVVASVNPGDLHKQLAAALIGIVGFIALTWLIGNIDRVMKLRIPVAVVAVGLLGVTLIVAEAINGANNWIFIGGVSIQPSELVKIAFVYVGASTLEKLQSTRSLTIYILFAVACVGMLFLMQDFGTALIFFFTFIVIAFMRSGDIRSIMLICVAALLGAALILYMKPYVADRFAAYRHVWEMADTTGYQQTRVLIYAASGGLLGVGIGNGKLGEVFASTSDLAFGMLCEEWGLLFALVVVLVFALLAVYTVKCAPTSRSSFYSIASCAATGMMLFQSCLNIFGVTDILPLTGVTLPFISQGGSSIICSWCLFAFIKAADIRTYPKLYNEPEVVLNENNI